MSIRNWRQVYYNRFSVVYDRFVALHSSDRQGVLRTYLAKKIAVSPGGRALDVCAGTGSLLQNLKERIRQKGLVVGIDFSRGMLSVAKNKLASRQSVSIARYETGLASLHRACDDVWGKNNPMDRTNIRNMAGG
ncbi:MAG: class I SAM-dependent methyltransferase [Deltaproteobacteria bacterium]|nr:class I SAM-dependent methyltransferase [Deltaproteobacteria bacterium]